MELGLFWLQNIKNTFKGKVSGVDLAKNLLKAYSGKDVGFYLLGENLSG